MELVRRFVAGLGAWMVLVAVCYATLQPGIRVIDRSGREQDLETLVAQSDRHRVIFIGENHDRYDHHLAQLEIIRRLDERAPGRWVIGVEFFQRRFQPGVDAYIEGALDEREFLVRTEYYDRWGYDYRLYRPIFRYARQEGIRVVALNAERELTREVSERGLDGLSAEDRALLPEEIDRSDDGYRERLEAVFEEHPGAEDFERFFDVQLVWDETMAERIADFLAEHPDQGMIVLAGRGHVAFGSGIPDRVRRRLPGIESLILLPADDRDADAQGADYVLLSARQDLPAAGRLGVTMDASEGVRVRDVDPEGAAARSGIEAGDRILAVDDAPIRSVADVRLALLDTNPGQRISVGVRREGPAGVEDVVFEVILQ